MRGSAPAPEGSLRGSLIIRAAWSNSHVAFHCAPAISPVCHAGQPSGREQPQTPPRLFCSRLVSLYSPLHRQLRGTGLQQYEPVWFALRFYSAALAIARDEPVCLVRDRLTARLRSCGGTLWLGFHARRGSPCLPRFTGGRRAAIRAMHSRRRPQPAGAAAPPTPRSAYHSVLPVVASALLTLRSSRSVRCTFALSQTIRCCTALLWARLRPLSCVPIRCP